MLHSLEAGQLLVKVAWPGRLTGLTVDTSLTTCATRGVTDAHVSISLGRYFISEKTGIRIDFHFYS